MEEKAIFTAKIIAAMFAIFLIVLNMPLFAFAQGLYLTQEEQDYINSKKTIKVASFDGGAPKQYKNSKGEIKGISINVLEEIKTLSGLNFEYILYNSIEDALKDDVEVFGVLSKEYLPPNILLSKPYLYSETVLFYNSSLNPEKLEGKRYAMIKGGTIPQGIEKEWVIYFNDREATFKAVNEGRADYSYSNLYSLIFYTLQNDYDNIITVPRKQENRAYGIGIKKDEEILLSIVNKSIEAISESRMQSLILSAMADVEKKLSLKMVLNHYGRVIIGFGLLVITILSYTIRIKVLTNKRLNDEIVKVKEREEIIKHISFHDSLTGLYNRAYLINEIERIDTPGQLPISIIIADINGLKIVNDSFGHEKGDKIIQKAAVVLRDSCRSEDVLARTGGDEFVIILPRTSSDTASQIVDKINSQCNKSCKDLVPVSISAGYATKSKPEEEMEDIVKEAEAMMYRHKLLESQSLRSSIISSLQASLHEKDIETKEHAQRLVESTARVGEKIGLSSPEMDDLNLFARLHDIGKVTVDERILKKKDALTLEEKVEIKRHPEAGYRIAESTRIMVNIAQYILHHHERWDGTGYPHGLKGEEIPLLSRILSIADAYDAMTNDRPYRKAMDKETAISELKKCSGKHFDPRLVPIFISVIEDM